MYYSRNVRLLPLSFCAAVPAIALLTLTSSYLEAHLNGRLADLLRNQGRQYTPNCFMASLYTFYPDMDVRYLNEMNFRYYLDRDFNQVDAQSANDGMFSVDSLREGDVLVFYRGSLASHAAYFVGSVNGSGEDQIFHRRQWGAQYGFALTPLSKVHEGLQPPLEAGVDERLAFSASTSKPFSTMEVYRFRGIRRGRKGSLSVADLEAVDLAMKTSYPRIPAARYRNISEADFVDASRYLSILSLRMSFNRVPVPEKEISKLRDKIRRSVDFRWGPATLDKMFGSRNVETLLAFLSQAEVYDEFKYSAYGDAPSVVPLDCELPLAQIGRGRRRR